MSLPQLLLSAQSYFPKLQIKYKDQSWLFKLIGYILFFNKDFTTSYVTTIGSTVYFPSEDFVKLRPISAPILLLHELTHVHDAHKINSFLFGFLYLFPQILILLFIPLFWINWILALILTVIFLLPLPAYFRMYFERRAYFISLYVLKSLSNRLHFTIDLDKEKDFYVSQFKTGAYYWMWPFKSIEKDFNLALDKINNNQRPFEDPIFDVLDKLIAQV